MLATARAEATEKSSRIAKWQTESGFAPGVSAAERSAWQQQYERFAGIAVPGRDEASLMGHLANVMSAPSLSGLELSSLANDEADERDMLVAREPFGSGQFQLTRLPMRARFDIRYADLLPVLERLQSREYALVLTKAEFQRHFPGIRVDLEVDVWVRREISS